MNETIDTVIIGGGQAGLSVSACLTQLGRPHIVLERAAEIGSAWRHQRWDSFTLVTPNWMIQLPHGAYAGPDPNGFMQRDEVVAYLEQYVARLGLPVRTGCAVSAVDPQGGGFVVHTPTGDIASSNVVVATGSFQSPKLPACAHNVPEAIVQVHSSQYRNPQGLPPGAVLVVGSAQSGCQIAEELLESGRRVFLCVGTAGRLPRRYRGRDSMDWFHNVGGLDRTVDKLPSPKARFSGNPHLTGKNGGHTLNLHRLARDGVVLLGRLLDVQAGRVELAPDLKENLARVDKFEADTLKQFDDYIAAHGLDAPTEDVPHLQDGFGCDLITQLDLAEAGISAIVWATGFSYDYRFVRLPVFDDAGYPIQTRGATTYPGLYFVGLHWLHKAKSTLLLGVGEDAQAVADFIAGRTPIKPAV